MNKANGGDGIPVELFQILKDDAVRVLHSICHQIYLDVASINKPILFIVLKYSIVWLSHYCLFCSHSLLAGH